jgi:hypothetical protein
MALEVRSVAVAIVSFALLSGCATRRPLSGSSLPKPPSSVLPQSMESPHTGQAADRVKNAIKSLGHEFRQRSLKSPKALAALQPIPLIPPSSAARRVGTSGSWSVVEATHDAPAKQEAFSQTQTSYGKSGSSPSRTRLAPWLLLAIAVAVTVGVIAARLQSSARGGVGHF